MSTQTDKKTYFGAAALISGALCVLSLMSNYGSSYLSISPHTFDQLNNLTALFFCILTPLTFILGVVGYTRKKDSKALSLIAIVLVVIPFLVILTQLVSSMLKSNL
jgi:hypothetical protein